MNDGVSKHFGSDCSYLQVDNQPQKVNTQTLPKNAMIGISTFIILLSLIVPLSIYAAESDTSVTTKHKIILSGKTVLYNATVGFLPVSSNDTVIAKVYYTYYYRTNGNSGARRPILFLYSGGPGRSSIGPHFGGTAGPVVANRDDDGYARYPEGWQTNDYSILDDVDLVYVDPIKTGFSRTIGNIANDDKRLFSTMGDMEYLSAWTRDFLAVYNRWLSPKFLLGGSYGTTRVAGMAGDLYSNHGILVNGVLLRAANGLELTFGFPESPEMSAMKLVFFTKSSYDKRLLDESYLNKTWAEVLHDAEQFIYGELMPFLFRIGMHGDDARLRMAEKYSAFSGIPADIIIQSDFDSRTLLDHYRDMIKPDALSQSAYENVRLPKVISHNTMIEVSEFPVICAAAWYHKLIPQKYLQKPLDIYYHEVMEFTMNELVPAYCRSSRDSLFNIAIAKKLIAVSGLPLDALLKEEGAVKCLEIALTKELLKYLPGLLSKLDINDKRFNPTLGEAGYNKVPAFNAYIQNELRFFSEIPYVHMASIKKDWQFSIAREKETATAAMKLKNAMLANPFLKVMFMAGYYDGNCSYMANEIQRSQLDRSGKMRNRIVLKGYASGHAIDRSNKECRQMNADIRDFIMKAIPKDGASAR